MKILKKIYILIIIIFINIHYAYGGNESFIAIKVNNEIITNYDIQKEYNYLLALNQNLQTVEKKRVVELAKNSIIKEKIKKIELVKYYILDQKNEHLNTVINNLYKSLELNNLEELSSYLLQYELTINDIKEKLEIETVWNDLIYTKFSNSIEIDEKKLKKKLDSNKKKTQKTYKLSEIMFTAKNTDELKKKYDEIKDNISKEGFKNTAITYSISDTGKLGGELGWINEDQLTPKFLKEIKKLKVNEITSPIVTASGQLIIKLNEKKITESNFNYEKELDNLVNYEKNRQLNEFSIIYYNKVKYETKIEEQ